MTKMRIRALTVLIGAALAVAAFVALPATAYADATIDISTLDASSVSSPAGDDDWVYYATTRQLRLTQENGDYTITGANANINVEVRQDADNVILRFDNTTDITSATDRTTLTVNADTTLYLTGISQLKSTAWHALQIGTGIEFSVGGGGSLKVLTTVNTNAIQNDGTLYIGGTSIVSAGSAADCIYCSENSSIWVGSGASLTAEGGWSGLGSSHELDLYIDGIANITGLNGVAIYMPVSPVINLIGSGTVSLSNENGDRTLSSFVEVYMDEDITLNIANTSTGADSHTYVINKRDATSTYAWKLTDALYAPGGDIRGASIVLSIAEGDIATIQLEPAPVCLIVETGVEYMTLNEALAAVDDGQTIELLANLTLFNPLVINNGKQFTLDNPGIWPGAANRTLDFNGNFFFIEDGTEVTFNGCSDYLNMPWVEIDHYGTGGSKAVFNGDLVFYDGGLWAGQGAIVTVNGNIEASGDGVRAEDGANVIVNGDVSTDGAGAYAFDGGVIYISGDVVAQAASPSSGNSVVYSSTDSLVEVLGNVTGLGSIYSDNEASVYIYGDVTLTGAKAFVFAHDGGYLRIAGNLTANLDDLAEFTITSADGSIVWVLGDVTSTANGVWAYSGSIVDIDGIVTIAGIYVRVGMQGHDPGQYDLAKDDYVTPTTQIGHLTYTDGISTVWIAEVVQPGPRPTPPTGDAAGLLVMLAGLSSLLGVGLLLARRRFTLG